MKNGWRPTKLGEILEIQNGFAFNSKLFSPDGEMPLIRIRDLKEGISTETRYSGDYDDRYVVKKGDLLIGMDGEFGCYQWKGPDALLNQRVCRLQNFRAVIEPRFLLYGVNQHLKEIEDNTGYSTVKHLSSKQVASIHFPVPPIEEQRRIVAILDEAFACIDKAKANTEKNIQNARELFDSYLNNIFSNPGPDWEEKRFDQVCVLQRGFDLPTQDRKPGKFALVTSNGITDRIDEFKVKGPGVATGRSGTIGNLHYIDEDYWPLNTALYIKDFHGNNERCVYYFLKHFDLSRFASGTGVPTLNRNHVHGETVSFPSLYEMQKKVAAQLDDLTLESQRLDSVNRRKIAELDELKRSILQKAFSGDF